MGFLAPTVDLPDQEGARLDSLNPSPIGYGKSIKRANGVKRIATTPLVQFPIVETVHKEKVESGGKGGGGSSQVQTSYTYSATFAVLIQDTPITGVSRIWMNNKLFYENRPFMTGDVLEAAELAAAKFKIYYGTDDQPVDPTLASRYGDQTPAYRGRAYIVFNDIQLAELGNRIPTVDVEVVENGVGSNDTSVYPYPTTLKDIVGQLCLRSGLLPNEFDVTQLTDRVVGYSVDTSTKTDKLIEGLMDIYHFYPRDNGDKLVFEKQPTPLIRKEYDTPCMINEDGYLVNAYHDVLGRQGYFPQEAGTSEGQFLIIRGMLLCYKATNDVRFLNSALNLVRPLVSMYGQDVPDNTDDLFIPHWLFVAKNPVIAQSNKLNYRAKFQLSNGEYAAFIPAGFPGHGEDVIKITNGYYNDGSFVSWDNPYAGLIGDSQGFGPPLRIETDETGSWVWYGPEIAPSGNPLYVTLNLMVIYNHGEWLSTSQNMEAWPHWRPMEKGEINCAVDTIPWALECYLLLEELTGDPKWTKAVEATKKTIDVVFDVDDGRNWMVPTLGDALSLPGTYITGGRPGFGLSSVSRTEDRKLKFIIPQGDGECQYGRGLEDTLTVSDTGVLVKFSIRNTGAAPIRFRVFVQEGKNVNTAYRYMKTYLIQGGESLTVDEEVPLSEFIKYELGFYGWWYVWDGVTYQYITPPTQIDVVGWFIEGAESRLGGSISSAELIWDTIRPLPVRQLPYTPGAAPFTANAFDGALIDWRGAPGIGYMDPMTWVNNSNPANLERMLDFIEDSQNEYLSRYGTQGPFMPSYVWDRFDRQQVTTDAPDTWTFDWVDPNTQWVGYTARVVAMTAECGYKTGNTRARGLAWNFLRWLEEEWDNINKFIPTNFPETLAQIQRSTPYQDGDIATPYNGYVYKAIQLAPGTTASIAPTFPTTIYDTVQDGGVIWQCIGWTYGTIPAYGDYDEPHAAALFMRAAGYIYMSGLETTRSLSLVTRCWFYLERLWNNAHGDVKDTWSHNPDNGEWFGFWSGEIMTVLALLLDEMSSVRIAANIPEATIISRLNSHMNWMESKTRTIVNEDLEDLFIGDDYSLTRKKETELPKKVEMSYYSASSNGDTDMRALERRSSRSEDIVSISTGVVMDGNEALRLAYLKMSQEYTQRIELEARLLTQLIRVGDVRQYNLEGDPITIQFTEVDLEPEGYCKVKAKTFDSTMYTYQVRASGDPISTTGVETVANTVPVILDIVNWDDSTTPGYYSYAIPTKSKWSGGGLFVSFNDNNYTQEASYLQQPEYGTVVNKLLDKKDTLIDDESLLTVVMTNGSLQSVTEEEFRAGVNRAYIGGELVLFKNAVLVGTNTYEVSRFMRGRRGTYVSMSSHQDGEQFLVLGDGLVSVDIPAGTVGFPRYYKGVSTGQAVGDVSATPFTIESNRLKPLEVAHLKGVRLQAGIQVTWLRRTRLSADWRDGVDAPLDDTNLLFHVDLLDGINGNLLRRIQAQNSSYFITLATLADVYGSSSATAYISVVQVNDVVGEGVVSQIQVD